MKKKLNDRQVIDMQHTVKNELRCNTNIQREVGLLFFELSRARAAEEVATAEAKRWQERYERQCELTDAAMQALLELEVEGDNDA